jgi:hypothetical protein
MVEVVALARTFRDSDRVPHARPTEREDSPIGASDATERSNAEIRRSRRWARSREIRAAAVESGREAPDRSFLFRGRTPRSTRRAVSWSDDCANAHTGDGARARGRTPAPDEARRSGAREGSAAGVNRAGVKRSLDHADRPASDLPRAGEDARPEPRRGALREGGAGPALADRAQERRAARVPKRLRQAAQVRTQAELTDDQRGVQQQVATTDDSDHGAASRYYARMVRAKLTS